MSLSCITGKPFRIINIRKWRAKPGLMSQHLADQLVTYLALADKGSLFAASRVSEHLKTSLGITGCFLDITTEVRGTREGPGIVRIMPAGN